jgi:predicted tellurium resistance membrane protein TerC
LFLVADVIFAVDSIPAVFGVTLDPFIIYTSNIFAVLSLRALYRFVSNVMTGERDMQGLRLAVPV